MVGVDYATYDRPWWWENKMKYEKLGCEIGRLVDEKQKAYGDSFGNAGRVLKILYPNGIPVEQYDRMMAVVRILDKLFRIATDKGAFGENPFSDIAGYGLLGSQLDGSAECGECDCRVS